MSATRDQAEQLRRQQAADRREPEWRQKPSTATERQAAGLLAEPVAEDDVDAADEHDAVTHPGTDPDRPRKRTSRTVTERQAAALHGR
jgi:hypothetical protein